MVHIVDNSIDDIPVVVSARVPRAIADALDARADAEGRKRSAVITHLLAEALKNVPVGQDGRRRWAA